MFTRRCSKGPKPPRPLLLKPRNGNHLYPWGHKRAVRFHAAILGPYGGCEQPPCHSRSHHSSTSELLRSAYGAISRPASSTCHAQRPQVVNPSSSYWPSPLASWTRHGPLPAHVHRARCPPADFFVLGQVS